MLDLVHETPKPKVIAGAAHDWELVIGMEVHAQVASQAKLFSGASTAFGAEPNANVSFVDAAMPGMLPVINEFCVEQAVRTGLGLKARINLWSAFDRKNYFYPDLPQGYQISQLYHPIVGEGEVIVDMGPGVARRVRIERIHLEQDAGKSIHDMDPAMSFVDLNRTGVALMEIVSRPDIRGPRKPRPMSPSSARSCATSAPATATCRTGTCARTSTSRSAVRAPTSASSRRGMRRIWGPGARSRT
jgi:aspartyl-tRNA(Asn)/glutamyl-tRNA(Gln) amidotransferase subunit B